MLILWITLKSWEYKKSLFAYISIEFPWPLKTLHSPLTNNCNKTKGEIKLWLFKIIVFACELESMAMVVTPVIKILFQQNYSYWKEFLNLGKFLLQQSEEQRCSKLVIHCYNPYFWTLVIGGVPFIHHFVTHVNACQHATITQRFTTG